MAISVLNTGKKVNEELIPALDQRKYFLLANDSCSRRDLFNFALALGVSQRYPTALEGKKSLIRNERMDNEIPLYDAVYFEEGLNGDTNRIDYITDDEKVFALVEEYAETGFKCIADALRNKGQDVFMQELIKEMNEIYKDLKDEYI